MTIQECRDRGCAHVSLVRPCRNCGVTDCSRYINYFEKGWWEEEEYDFEGFSDEWRKI